MSKGKRAMKKFVVKFEDAFDATGAVSGTNVVVACPLCGVWERVFIPKDKARSLEIWCSNESRNYLIQDLFDFLSSTERETLISGLCKDCQDVFFDENDDRKEV